MDLYIYGAGKRGQILAKLAKDSEINIIGILDSDKKKQGLEIDDFIVESPDVLSDKEDANVCVSYYSSLLRDPIWDYFTEKYNIKKEKVYSFNDIIKKIYLGIGFPEKVINMNICKIFFSGDWTMKLGGVESWLRDIVQEFLKRHSENIYLLTDKKKSNYPNEISDVIVDFYYLETPVFSEEYVKRGMEFIVYNLPCKIVFSRVDELLLAAFLVKKQFPNDIQIIMVDHGACDGMSHDIASYSDVIDHYVAVSSGIKQLLIEQGVNSNRIDVMTCPIADNFNTKLRDFNKECIQIGYAGRLEIFEKRIDILLKLIDQLELKNIKYEFNIAGNGSCYDMIVEHIKKKQIENKIHMLGMLDREAMPAFWNKQDIAINVSDNEGRPLSNMEAMINGAVPIVTETIGCIEDVIDGENGYIVPIGDYLQMSNKIEYIYKHRDILKLMSNNAHNTMREKVCMNKHIELWSKILDINL